ncbi:unnamed protein product [Allacma fusca]|uniref:DUF5641 domain-containing protein n=1 Tax=Allacma fusca TaxID=39272 RepID=A0A8J2PP59_9HEXA|nr:unnamed protein product [Allacma fusca]
MIRWRFYLIPMCADIKMMYRHIWMNPECWTYLRVLWRETPKLPLQEYWLKTVTYGTASAPAQAVLVLQTIAEKNKESHPLAHKSILRDFYMDDCMTGASTLVEALELQKQLMSVLKSTNLILRKWSSSESAVLAAVPEEFRETQLPLSFNYDETVKTLGMYWSPLADDFRFTFQSRADTVKVTKRTVLSEIAKLFDPLGLMSPVTIRGKLIMQSLWKLQINWDQVLPSDMTQAWKAFYRDLLQITRIRIPRCITGPGEVRHELHGFSDASEQAYAAVVYLRNVNSTGNVTVLLIASKSKCLTFLPPEQIKTATLEEKLVIVSHSVNLDMSMVEKYSSLGKLQRHSAWLARFCMYLQVKNRTTILRGPLTVKELNSVLNVWIRAAQRTHFSEEVTALKSKIPIPRKSHLLTLCPMLDDAGLLRVGRRLEKAPLSFNERHPILLPRSHRLTRLIVENMHRSLKHAGCQLDERFPPQQWKMARVLKVHPGNDDRVRVATVKTADGELVRPIVKLCRLPVEEEA